MTHDESGRPQALQIASARYTRPQEGTTFAVDLIGAVHVGDRGYYAELNQRFRIYDTVLFELIAPPDTQHRIAETERKGFITGAQLTLTRALGLSFQLDEIDYGASNLVHADLSPDELLDSMEERGESLYVYFWRMFYASVQQASEDPLGLRALSSLDSALFAETDNPLKVAFAYEMTNVRALGSALEGASGSAVIAARNLRALDVLVERMDRGDRQVGIFYGVGHMPDFERRLVNDMRFEYHDTRWVDAWRLDEPTDLPLGQDE
ncbi:MAG: hypothetical protein AAF417_10145 [Pseudomonadota bacterium]